MKGLLRIIVCLILMLSLYACGNRYNNVAPGVNSSMDNTEAVIDNTALSKETAVCKRVAFEHMYSDVGMEYALISGFDENDNTIWEYTTGQYPATQLDLVNEIGFKDDRYYYTEDGSIIALDTGTGEIVWTNDEYMGAVTDSVMGDDAIYLCGYFGPDFFAVSFDGETVCNIRHFNDTHFWASKIELLDMQVLVHLFGGSENGAPAVFSVDLITYDFKLENEG